MRGFLLFQGILPALRRPSALSATGLNVDQHVGAAIDWIGRARAATSDGGVSKGFGLLRSRWSPSYPETTGYMVPTLLRAAELLDRPELQALALSLAGYLLKSVTAEGAVAHWASPGSYPIVFDTGQVVFGWLAAFQASGEERYLNAATRAGDWLAWAQDPSGCWKEYQHLGVPKVIDTRVAWALLELSHRAAQDSYRRAAVRNLEWALGHQDPDGWFRRCAFTEDEDPFTHTIAYTAEGFLECGCLLDETCCVEAARLTADALLALQRPDGRLSSTYARGWRATACSTCLTGNCQVALLWLRLYGLNGQTHYLDAARRAIAFVASTQHLNAPSPNIRGGIAGSHPIWGRYERFQYPNWAAKFFIDALLALQEAESLYNGLSHRATSFPG